jgi:hypothetical protein
MSNKRGWWQRVAWTLAALLCVSTSATAQVFTGRIDVTVQDSTGALLPGVTVDITGPQNESSVTDAIGEAHFLNLPPGTYQVKATLQGFAEFLNRAVPVGAGVTVPLRVTLAVAGVAEQVNVAAETPVVDVRRQAVATNVTLDELQNIPSSRDPWVVLQTVPGVYVDRVNVGGAESGQQSEYVAKGADTDDNTWYIDGIPITDMTALGSSPTYYDFDMFQEMQVTTGGADPLAATPGVQLNFVLKSGTNQPRGSARLFFANESLQSNNMPQELVDQGLGGESGQGNRTDQYADYGVEFGGPVVRDKWWAWGSYAKTDVRILTLNGVSDDTILEDAGLKTNAQFNDAWRAGFTFFSGNKKKDGRGAGPLNPPETTFVQDGPSKLYKGEVNWVASNTLFVTARGAVVNGPFTLEPKGGRDKQVYIDANGVYHNTNQFLDTSRPQRTLLADATWFRGRHELKFGASWRHVEDETLFGFGNGYLNIALDEEGTTLAIPFREYVQRNAGDYSFAYIGDTISWDRLTANVSLRYDRTTNSALEASAPAHADFPDVLPAVNAPEVKNAIVWNTLSPRAGVTYALDSDRKTLARASYASFASQLNVTYAGEVSASSYAYAYYLAVDADRSFSIEPGEIIRQISVIGVDPDNPLLVVNQIQPDLKSPRTHELVFGIDRELMPNFGMTAAFTWRRFNDPLWFPLIGVTQDDYVEDGRITDDLPGLGAFDQPFYALREEAAPLGGGTILSNREGYHRTFRGFELSATKRLANRWMGRFAFAWNDEREYFDDPSLSIQDPTPSPEEPLLHGGPVTRQSLGSSKSEIYLVAPKYQFIANGFYQGPWGVNFGANLLVRQGFGKPYYADEVETSDPVDTAKDVLVVGDVGDYRLPTLTSFDLRAEKAFTFGQRRIAFDVDIFNVFNRGTVLGRQYDVQATGDTGFDKVLEIMNPRIIRFGLRVTF